jgi:3-hydroxybutyryl-CoA dehydrogenase
MTEKLAVYGTGTIGSCEATLITGHGLPVVAVGHSEEGLTRCRRAVEQNWDDLIANGLAQERNKRAALALLTLTRDPRRPGGVHLRL